MLHLQACSIMSHCCSSTLLVHPAVMLLLLLLLYVSNGVLQG
jgi:hypothetical protein